MNYQQTINYIFEALPMYQRVGATAYKADLEKAFLLDAYFGNSHKKFKKVHVAGTNGKGSVSHILASVFQSAGYKTGLYTSPHLTDFRERIKIDGKVISKDFVTEFTSNNFRIFEQTEASFFEMTVFMAFEYFARKEVDVAIIEVGLGGRLDTTNIISPELSVITNIGLDHTKFLGSDLTSIAKEKAGIIKKNVPVVVGKTQPETEILFTQIAKEKESPIDFADQLFQSEYQLQNLDNSVRLHFSRSCIPQIDNIETDLGGIYQTENIITSLTALNRLSTQGFVISQEAIRLGVRNVIVNTGLKGRWQEIDHNPLVICDIAHNTEGIRQVLLQIKNIPYKKLHLVLGFVSDKRISEIIAILPREANYYLCEPAIPRAMRVDELAQKFQQKNYAYKKYTHVVDAYQSAKEHASKNDLIYIGGSTFVVADLLAQI